MEPPRAFVANSFRPDAEGCRRDAGYNGTAGRAVGGHDVVWQSRRVLRLDELCEAVIGAVRGLVSQRRDGDSARHVAKIAPPRVRLAGLRNTAGRPGCSGLNSVA